MHERGLPFLLVGKKKGNNAMARQIKGLRKAKSLYNRSSTFNYIHGVFQKSYLQSTGSAKNRLETACKAVDDVIRELTNKTPNKKSFYALVVEDFKQYLLTMADNEKLIAEAVEATKPKEPSRIIV